MTDDLDTLARLHHKGGFIEELKRAGELVPKTAVIRDLSDWQRAVEEIPFPAVLKPAYSRFATQVHFMEEPAAEPPVSLDRPWVLQERIPGPQLSTYAVAHRGRLTAYSCYRRVFRVGTGSSITFRHEAEPSLYRWTERLVQRYRYTGQIAFDFIQSDKVWSVLSPGVQSPCHQRDSPVYGRIPGGGDGGKSLCRCVSRSRRESDAGDPGTAVRVEAGETP